MNLKFVKYLLAAIYFCIAILAFMVPAFSNPFHEFRVGSFIFGMGVMLYGSYYLWWNFSKNKYAVTYRMNRFREFTGEDVEKDVILVGKFEYFLIFALGAFFLLVTLY